MSALAISAVAPTWDAAQEIPRTDPLTQAMIAQLGIDEAQVDALLTRAAELVA